MPFTPKFVDLVRNVATVTGTGPVTLGGAVSGYSSLAAAMTAGDQFYYAIQGIDKPVEREIGRGTMQADGKVARQVIAGSLTNFTGGAKTIALVAAAEWFATLDQLAAGAAAGVASRSELAARQGGSAVLKETGRAGLFAFDPSNQSAKVAADSGQGIYVAPASDPTGASGAWVRRFDGPVNPMWFGIVEGDASGANGAANSTAFAALLATLRIRAKNASTNYQGLEIVRFPAGYFEFAETIDITNGSLILEGADGGYPGGRGSVLKFPTGVSGVRVQRYNTSGATATDGVTHRGGDGSIIRNLALRGAYSSTLTEAEAHGIHLRARAVIENVYIEEFEGDGIHSSSPGADNSNNTRVTGGRIQECRNGIYLDGPDANIWAVNGVDVSSNRAWGINDSSFLGNTFTGCHAATNGWVPNSIPTTCSYSGNRYAVKDGQAAGASTNAPSGTTADNSWWIYKSAGAASATFNIVAWVSGLTWREGGAYRTNNSNARSVFVGCYSEGDQGPSQLISPTLVLGGLHSAGVKGTAAYVRSVSTAGAVVADGFRSSFNNGTSDFNAQLGEANLQTGLLITDSVAAPSSWRLKLSGNDLIFDYANSSAQRAFRITGPNTTEQFGTGAAQPHAFYPPHLVIGDSGENSGNARRVVVDIAAPTTGAHAQGEIVFNRAPTAGGPMGWMCVASGTPGTWKAMANLAP